MNDDELLEEITMVEESFMATPTLSVMVDFNDLYTDHQEKAFELIGKLKDLLA